MAENLGSIIVKGLDTWKNNLNICLPFVFSSVLTFVVAVIVIGSATFMSGTPFRINLSYLTKLGGVSPAIIPQLPLQLLQSIGAIILFVILGLIINAFFAAGAIGMAKEAMEREKASLSDMTAYGKRKFTSMLTANIIVGLIVLAGVAFLIPGFLAITPYMTVLKWFMLAYMAIVSIMFALTPFAVVIGDFGAIGGVKKGVKLFWAHKFDVFLLGVIVLVIGLVVSYLTSFIPYIGQLINIVVSVIFILPLTVLWWTKLYMCMTAPRRLDVL